MLYKEVVNDEDDACFAMDQERKLAKSWKKVLRLSSSSLELKRMKRLINYINLIFYVFTTVGY
jgi:hypothetical protein